MLLLGIMLLVLAIGIGLVLWQEKNERAISMSAADHQQIIVYSVKMKEELANMQLHLMQLLSTTKDSPQSTGDFYGSEYNPTVTRYSLQFLLDSIRALQVKTGSLNPVTEKLGTQLSTLFSYDFKIDPAANNAGDRMQVLLQSL